MQYNNLPIFQIGKNGVSKNHLINALKVHKIIKIKFLKKEFMEKYSQDLPGKVLKKIGLVIILKKN